MSNNNFIKLNMYKVEFVSNSEGEQVGREIGDTEPIHIAVKHILSLKPNTLDDGTEDCYIFVNDFTEPVHVKESASLIISKIELGYSV